jgi:zinc transport system substrate-binding protein
MRKVMFVLMLSLCASQAFAVEKLNVITSITPLYSIVSAIGGDSVNLSLVIPPGASPHTFAPRPSQIINFARADVFVQVGAGMEYWADKVIRASGNKKLVIISCSDGLDLIRELYRDTDDPHSKTGAANPHVWLDPVNVKFFSGRIAEALGKARPELKTVFDANYAAFAARLDALDMKIKKDTSQFSVKQFVEFHPAWEYFAKRYGLTPVGTIEEFPGKEPTPKEIQKIIKQIDKYGIKAVFAEPQLSPKAAKVIADEAHVKVVMLDPEGKAGQSGNGDYILLMERNLEAMKEAMK